jgi:hypothetical protein
MPEELEKVSAWLNKYLDLQPGLQGTLVIKELPFKEPSAGLLAGLDPSLRSGAGWILDRHRLNNDCT